ncbi:MAG: hypothetical protein ACOCV2_05590 [Persicimonas sp.]
MQQETVDDAEQEQSVTVWPEFQIQGTSTLPEELNLETLGLTISEIQLEPVDSERDSIAYSTREPNVLTFDLSEEETSIEGDALTLPEEGTYLINVRLEPITEVEETSKGTTERVYSSFSVSGSVSGDDLETTTDDPRLEGRATNGRPIPVPYETDDDSDEVEAKSGDEAWTEFHYDSERSVFVTLDEVELEEGEQVLSFEFDVSQWAMALLEPLIDALEDGDGVQYDDGAVDVSNPLESRGHGAESLLDDAQVDSL